MQNGQSAFQCACQVYPGFRQDHWPYNADRSLGQNQYASRYAHGRLDEPNLGEGLRWKNLDSGNYHSIMIHRDDLEEFHRRVRDYRKQFMGGLYGES